MNIILIHGSWHGAWCWEKVIPLLESAGHQVYAPDLPGHGQDKTPREEITLDAYVECVERILSTLSTPALLVGHSMAGMVISQVAEHFPEKINRLVYLAGFLPQNGETLLSIAKLQKPTKATVDLNFVSEEQAIYFPISNMRAFAYHRCEASVFEALLPLFCVEPLQTWVTPVQNTTHRFGRVPRVYIECADDRAITLASQQRMNQQSPCTIFRLDCDHSPFYSDPRGLAAILLKLALADNCQ
jgi:pimeloyl-ACP methyl ester carboxylesterase